MDIAGAVFYHFRLALEDEDDGAAGAAYGKGLIALVQDQYRMVQHIGFALLELSVSSFIL